MLPEAPGPVKAAPLEVTLTPGPLLGYNEDS
jgi:hypothetical protein